MFYELQLLVQEEWEKQNETIKQTHVKEDIKTKHAKTIENTNTGAKKKAVIEELN